MLIEELEFEISQLSEKHLLRVQKYVSVQIAERIGNVKPAIEDDLITSWCYERIRQSLIAEHGAIRVEDIAPWKSLKAKQQLELQEAWKTATDYFVKRGITPGDVLAEFIIKLTVRSSTLDQALSPKAITTCLRLIRHEFISQMGKIYEDDSSMVILNQALHKNVDAGRTRED